jgi:hypothetical protein
LQRFDMSGPLSGGGREHSAARLHSHTRVTMRHPEVLFVPVLMVLDYYLTLYGAHLAEQSYRRHFKTKHYELNPIWQSAVARRHWINLRHLALVVLMGGILVLLAEVLELESEFLNPLLGFVLTSYGVLLGRHLCNILTFAHLTRCPEEVVGEVRLSHNFVISLSIYQLLAVGLPIIFVAIFSPSGFVFGAVTAVLTMGGVKTLWLVRSRKTRAKHQMP